MGRRKKHQRSDVPAEGSKVLPPDRLIMGRNCLRETLRHCPQRLLKVFVGEDRGQQSGRDDLLVKLRELQIPVEAHPRSTLSAIAGSDSHQSFVALVKKRDSLQLHDFLAAAADRDSGLLLLLDSIYDPQNLGAILRAAECFGVDAVMWSKNRGCGITAVVAKASVGATELLPLIMVSNLADALAQVKDAGFWVVAADLDPDAQNAAEFDFPAKTALLLGSEGVGLRERLRRSVDFKVRIPLPGRIESLNVSQATAVLLHHLHNLPQEPGVP